MEVLGFIDIAEFILFCLIKSIWCLGLRQASLCIVMEEAPASMNPLMKESDGSWTIGCTSSGTLVFIFFTNSASTVVGGTNTPSIISTCIKSEYFSTSFISSFILEKSADKIDGASFILGIFARSYAFKQLFCFIIYLFLLYWIFLLNVRILFIYFYCIECIRQCLVTLNLAVI